MGRILACIVVVGIATAARADDLSPLGAAVSKGDVAEVTRQLDAGADPDETVQGYTMLTWAAGTGKLPIVKILVEHHAKVDPKIDNGFTPLVAAASNKHADIAEYLIAHGAKVNVQGSNGWTPLDDAEGNHDAKTAKVLRAHGGVSGLPPLLGAVNRGETAKVKKLLASGADPDSHDTAGGTAISIAANVGALAIVKLLVAAHADVDAADQNGYTPLMEASQNGHADVVAFLLAHGAKVDPRNREKQSALDIAVSTKHDDVAKLLRDHGATDAPPPAPAAPTAPTDADCADYRADVEMGPKGYASLVAGPAPAGSIMEAVHEKPATISLGGSDCTVSDDASTLTCTWKGGAKDYDGLASVAVQCSAGSKIDQRPGKTMIWYGGVPDTKALIKIFTSDDDLVIRFVGSKP
ncbi:MAG TPA: ankyrin repeat domain-containing protein [Kofleriaceae bacterium]|nr:ankyrin repeat domain-containing protein [Kofleriaceae bacterium]